MAFEACAHEEQAQALRTAAAALESAWVLWLNDVNDSLIRMRTVLELTAKAKSIEPSQRARQSSKCGVQASTPRRWLEAAGWGRLEPILTGIRRMPSTEVSMALKSAMHRDANRARNWKANDVVDMDAMSLAVPYCDIVVTEKASHEVLTAAHLDARAGTIILRNLVDLTCVLA